MKQDTHKSRLLDYLKLNGRITSLQSIQELGNLRLAASIFTLRNEGHKIKSINVTVGTRWGNTTTVVEYIYYHK